jgi:hypothetical protein
MNETSTLERTTVVRHGRRLEYFTIAWNTLEGLVAVVAGAIAGSISLVGFGIDSFIEVTSGSVLLWRMSVDAEVHRREMNERRALGLSAFAFSYWRPTSPMNLFWTCGPAALPNTAFRESFWPASPWSQCLFSPEPSERWEMLSAAPRCTRTPNKRNFARTCPPSCSPAYCSTPFLVCRGPIRRRPSFPHYGSYYRERGIRRIAWQSLLPKLRTVTPVNLSASSNSDVIEFAG